MAPEPSFLLHVILNLASLLPTKASTDAHISVGWTLPPTRNATAVPTFQNSVDPYYRMDSGNFTSKIAPRVFDLEARLNARFVRHALWFPYPRLAVAELFEPKNNQSFWDFSLIDPTMNAFMKVTSI